ncbi:MAG: tRNA pseudouridine(38-40) synthase TruA [Chloroflexi bacterium]|nr:MAG: tRNA pseudouridine(38-40) synthase TruA [Chloroflexota bacterium]
MARNIKLVLEYEGTGYHGWQQQACSTPTIEGALRRALRELTGETPDLQAAGRTDAGVHARGQVVNFRLDGDFAPQALPGALNHRLPPDIVVRSAEVVDDGFHARYSARSRRYEYHVRQAADRAAYVRQYCWPVPERLDLIAMEQAARLLEGRHDFRAFGRSPRPGGHTLRTVHEIHIEADGDWVTIAVTADAFLYGMVRTLAAVLVDVGRGRRTLDSIRALRDAAQPTAIRPAPAQGLVQAAVTY